VRTLRKKKKKKWKGKGRKKRDKGVPAKKEAAVAKEKRGPAEKRGVRILNIIRSRRKACHWGGREGFIKT